MMTIHSVGWREIPYVLSLLLIPGEAIRAHHPTFRIRCHVATADGKRSVFVERAHRAPWVSHSAAPGDPIAHRHTSTESDRVPDHTRLLLRYASHTTRSIQRHSFQWLLLTPSILEAYRRRPQSLHVILMGASIRIEGTIVNGRRSQKDNCPLEPNSRLESFDTPSGSL